MQSTSSLSTDTISNCVHPRPHAVGPTLAPVLPARGPHELLEHVLEPAAHLLPEQAPLEMFVHHNTLHALQYLPFHEALRIAHDQ